MARGGHGLRKVLLGPAMTDPLLPAGGSLLKGLAAVSGEACLQLSSFLLDTSLCTPMPSHDNLSEIIYYFSILQIDIVSIEKLFCFATILFISIENQIPNTTCYSQIPTAWSGRTGLPVYRFWKYFCEMKSPWKYEESETNYNLLRSMVQKLSIFREKNTKKRKLQIWVWGFFYSHNG
jgi:hypothetical protein